jgi:hypothetical protein
MDDAVSLVQVYLRLNGYFTVTEYPVIEAHRPGAYRTATDIDVLGLRFPDVGAPFSIPHAAGEEKLVLDPLLARDGEAIEMLIGEVKEGRAELNRGAVHADILRATLARFGCCTPREMEKTIPELIRHGRAVTPCGHRLRLVAFGSTPPEGEVRYNVITLAHVFEFLQRYIERNWEMIRTAQFKDPAFAFLVMQEKARRGVGSGV